jgi:hypothetical protein
MAELYLYHPYTFMALCIINYAYLHAPIYLNYIVY